MKIKKGKHYHLIYALVAVLLVTASCNNSDAIKPPFRIKSINYNQLPANTEDGHYNAVIEIPAGTNKKIEYNKESKKFEIDQRDGKDRIINFLPYPGNYGYVPGTLMDKERGGDGDAVDILVLAESLPTGTVISVKPIASLLLFDEGEADTKLIAIPIDTSLQTMRIQGFEHFMIDYDAAKHLIETWFMNYDGLGTNEFRGWKNEEYAEKEIEKWLK